MEIIELKILMSDIKKLIYLTADQTELKEAQLA